MSKKVHIVTIGYQDYAIESLTQATQVLRVMEKAVPCSYHHVPGDASNYMPEEDRKPALKLEINMNLLSKPKPKPKKALALPAPKRGTILCICEKSYVAPKQSCPHCGRAFSESHNRTHDDKPLTPSGVIPFKLNP
jgi:hypothetical protein